MPYLRSVVIGQSKEYSKEAKKVLPGIIKALTDPLTDLEKTPSTYVPKKPQRIAMTGTYEEVQDYFVGDQSIYKMVAPHCKWTDGFPIIPPTEEKVAKMLEGTSHPPDEVFPRPMPPSYLTFTVEKVAINGVMAGCKPEHMPILLAMAEAWTKLKKTPALGITSDTGFGHLEVVSGPIAKEVGMNSGQNILNPGNLSNATLGRAARLILQNLGGARFNEVVASTYGNPMNYSCCFADIMDKNNPWSTLSEDAGFKRDESTLNLFLGFKYHAESFALLKEDPIPYMAERVMQIPIPTGTLFFVSPTRAKDLTAQGLDKLAVKKLIHEKAFWTIGRFKKEAWGLWQGYFPDPRPGREGKLLARNDWEGIPDDHKINLPGSLDQISVIVAGSNARSLACYKANKPTVVSIDKWR